MQLQNEEIEQAFNKLNKETRNILVLALIVFCIIIGAYFLKYDMPWTPLPLPDGQKNVPTAITLEERRAAQAVWGQLGDYIGGVMNPILSFLTIYLLIKTMQLQSLQIQQAQSVIKSTNTSNEIAILGQALNVVSEDLAQMQKASTDVTPQMYQTALDRKIKLASAIIERALKIK